MHIDVTEDEARYLAEQLERRLATLEDERHQASPGVLAPLLEAELTRLRALTHRFRRLADDASLVG